MAVNVTDLEVYQNYFWRKTTEIDVKRGMRDGRETHALFVIIEVT